MGQTPTFKLPYPEQGDPVDVAGDIKKLADAVDAKATSFADQKQVIGAEFQAVKVRPGINRWFQFGNAPAWQAPWESVWWSSRWPGGEAAIKNGKAGSPGAIEVPYTGLWNITLHFETDEGNSVWIGSVDAPGYSYGNRWAWLWDMRINHGMVTGREYFLTKGALVSFLAYCRESNGRGSGQVNGNVWMRVIMRYVGPLEGAPTNLPPIPLTADPNDPAVTNAPLP